MEETVVKEAIEYAEKGVAAEVPTIQAIKYLVESVKRFLILFSIIGRTADWKRFERICMNLTSQALFLKDVVSGETDSKKYLGMKSTNYISLIEEIVRCFERRIGIVDGIPQVQVFIGEVLDATHIDKQQEHEKALGLYLKSLKTLKIAIGKMRDSQKRVKDSLEMVEVVIERAEYLSKLLKHDEEFHKKDMKSKNEKDEFRELEDLSELSSALMEFKFTSVDGSSETKLVYTLRYCVRCGKPNVRNFSKNACKHTQCSSCGRYFCHICLRVPSGSGLSAYDEKMIWNCGSGPTRAWSKCQPNRSRDFLFPRQTKENRGLWYIGDATFK